MFGQGFPGYDRVFLVLCRVRGPLCRDMARKLDAVARSRHSCSMSRHSFSMSRQCFASLSWQCHDRDGHDKRLAVSTGLALGKDFMSQQSVFMS